MSDLKSLADMAKEILRKTGLSYEDGMFCFLTYLSDSVSKNEKSRNDFNVPSFVLADLKSLVSRCVELPVDQRLSLIALLNTAGPRGFNHWLREGAAQKISEMVQGGGIAQFQYDCSLYPALLTALNNKNFQKIEFVTLNERIVDEARLVSESIGVDIIAVHKNPLFYKDSDPDVVLSCPPFMWKGVQIPSEMQIWMGADERTSARITAESAIMADAVIHKNRRSIILVANGVLFRDVGVEKITRQRLIASGSLLAVLSLPPFLALEDTALQTSLLVIGKSKNMQSVRFVDLSDSKFSTMQMRGRREPVPETSWDQAIKQPIPAGSAWARDVSLSEIETRGGVLSLERYFSTDIEKRVEELRRGMEVQPLERLVNILRPYQLKKGDEGSFLAREAVPSDVGEDGYLMMPSREVNCSEATFLKIGDARLQPNDLVISVKGNIGIVGIVPNSIKDNNEKEIWVPGQSMLILRNKKTSQLSSVVLREILSSEIMSEYIKTLSGGTTVQMISIKDLKNIRIPIPSYEKIENIENDFSRRKEIFFNISSLKKEMKSNKNIWPYNI